MTELDEAKKRLLYFAVTCINVDNKETTREFTNIISGLINDVESYAKIEVLNELK